VVVCLFSKHVFFFRTYSRPWHRGSFLRRSSSSLFFPAAPKAVTPHFFDVNERASSTGSSLPISGDFFKADGGSGLFSRTHSQFFSSSLVRFRTDTCFPVKCFTGQLFIGQKKWVVGVGVGVVGGGGGGGVGGGVGGGLVGCGGGGGLLGGGGGGVEGGGGVGGGGGFGGGFFGGFWW